MHLPYSWMEINDSYIPFLENTGPKLIAYKKDNNIHFIEKDWLQHQYLGSYSQKQLKTSNFQCTPSQCPIFRTSPSPFYAAKPEPDFQLCSAHVLGGSCTANEEKRCSEVAFLLLLLLCTVLIGATDLLFTIFPVCKSTLDSQKFFCWPSGSHFLKEFSIQMTPSFPEKISLFILMSLGA